MRYTNLYCCSCFMELIRPQLTCGKAKCMRAWKEMSDDQKDRARAMAAMSKSERAYAEVEEEAIRADERQQRANEVREQLTNYQETQQQREQTPAFLRKMMEENAPIIKEEDDQ